MFDHSKYKYHHIGIPTTEKLKDEIYLANYDVYFSGYGENDFNVEWMRYGENCAIPEIVKQLPHVAFEVDDVHEAIKGHEVIIQPNSPYENIVVAFVLINDAPVEFLQYIKKE